ncbi:class I SAM-dependent methyltransferase [Phenylobacterium sp.]|jgi:SAM-dependent MidA family methyltransferase|uniref:class I SAM-dependent methyltransferase n=1 Tax=Phenylobacterium sp. TaxID=1871053 RepID=UPI002F3F59B0
MSLRDRLAGQVRAGGPLTVAQYMTACLHDPDFGYYATRPGLGADGDFITAPLVSQMFGELIGVWAAECWDRLGRPARVLLVEAGPGDGTLMGDVLRAAGLVPQFLAAAEVWLVEVSEPLRAVQRARLGEDVRWAKSLGDLPAGAPVILLANELLDCLPARQWVRTAKGWSERMVGLDAQGALAFGLGGAAPPVPSGWAQERPGDVLEVSAAQEAFGDAAGALAAREGGCALLIDYGRAAPGPGDTLQALRRHQKVDPLATPGEADLTVHADFPAVLAAAARQGASLAPLLTQGEFLRRLGIEARAAALSRARPDRAGQVARQLERLTGPDQMGELFKAACVHSPGWTPPGFEEQEEA